LAAAEESVEAMLKHMDIFGIERMALLFSVADGAKSARREQWTLASHAAKLIERWPDRLIGIATLNATNLQGCLDGLNRWIRDGPMSGVFFLSSAENLPCSHPNFDPIAERTRELDAVFLQHTWFKTGGKDSVGESTPSELAELAKRHPQKQFICVHAGGEWEKGIRAVYDCPNILVETSGFDPTSGFIDMAVRELGANRIVYGGHYPGRSFGTELSKVLGADISDGDRQLIFGENFRQLLAPIFRKQGRSFNRTAGSARSSPPAAPAQTRR
jgi:predicted TIM-barrel fold metal-dependent hydrolase